MTDALLEIMAEESFVDASGMEAFKNLLAAAFAGLWIIGSTLAAPLAIQKMISEGTNIGLSFIQGGYGAAKAGVQSGATAGAAVASTGVGAPAAAAGAAVAGALASGSAAMTGASSSGIGGLAYNAAKWGEAAFKSSDPANDKKASAAIRKSRNRR